MNEGSGYSKEGAHVASERSALEWREARAPRHHWKVMGGGSRVHWEALSHRKGVCDSEVALLRKERGCLRRCRTEDVPDAVDTAHLKKA